MTPFMEPDATAADKLPRTRRSLEAFRRIADVVVSMLVLGGCGSLMLLMAWLIRRESPGPAIFRQTRAGSGGRPFVLLKFRTMRIDSDPYGASPHSGGDPRLTRIGRLLRELSLDELPQFVNVFRGDMTLVGPRPLYLSQAAEWTQRQRLRLTVKPGMTGMAQTRGRGALTIEDKLELDVQYVLSRSMALDARLLLETILMLFRRANIYEVQYSRAETVRGGGKVTEQDAAR